MLNAIVGGKAGRTNKTVEKNTPWRDVFSHKEDLLTASVFERLSYLDASKFWSILEKTYKFKENENTEIRLLDIKFWPRWYDSKKSINYTEPDMFLVFSQGHGKGKTALIVETKRHDNNAQSAAQWVAQINAFQNQLSQGNFSEIEIDELYYLAIGGLGSYGQDFIKVRDEVKACLSEADGLHVSFFGSSWLHLTNTIKKVSRNTHLTHEQNILNDILKALNLAGYREVVDLKTIVKTNTETHSQSLLALKWTKT